MSHRLQEKAVVILLVVIAVNRLVFADEADLAVPLPVGIEFVEAEFRETSILEDIAAPIIQVLFGEASVLEGVTGLVEVVVDAMIEEDLVDVDGMITVEESLQQLRPMMITELGFVRLVCGDLTIEQRAAVRAAAEANLKQSAAQLAAARPNPEHANVVGVLLESRPEPLFAMREAISEALKVVLTDEQFGRYSEIAVSRIAQRKQAAILMTVSRLDRNLLLSSDQRENLIQALSSQWQSQWEQWQGYQDDSLPMIPNNLVTSYLDDSQKSVWLEMQKFGCDQIWEDDAADAQFNDGWWGEVVPGADAPEDGFRVEKWGLGF